MTKNDSTSLVRKIMAEFADLTGLSFPKTPRRYLWTDSFAVCNFLELYNRTGDSKYLQLALRLVDQVHHILGRHREDDPRKGWISGLSEKEGEKHPTIGGLRIGKKMDERRPSDPFDDRLEWDRDGQYYHYLTKWMHALNRVSRVTGDPNYNTWAIELAKTAHAKFTYAPSSGGRKRMYWKMSIDLSHALVPSMGHHDPLDGFITYNQLQATATGYFKKLPQPDLGADIFDMANICKGKSWVTEDPLGIGELLYNAYEAAQLMVGGHLEETDLPALLLDSSLPGLASYAAKDLLDLPADYRLAFRELGLAIGLRAVEELRKLTDRNRAFFEKYPIYRQIEAVMHYMPLCEMIETFWLDHRKSEGVSWIEHRDINMVMLATDLAPGAYLAV